MKVIAIFTVVWILVGICGFVRINIASKNQIKVIDAVAQYNYALVFDGKETDTEMFLRMESFDKTMFRFWDFGCKRILPAEDYEKIKEYL